MKAFPFSVVVVVACFTGCGDDAVDDPEQVPGTDCNDGDTRCVDGDVAVCVDGVFGTAEACGDDSVCLETACEPVSATVQVQADSLELYAASLNDNGSFAFDLDGALDDAKRALFLTDGNDRAFALAVTTVFLAQHGGHTSIGFGPDDFSACGERDSTYQFTARSWFGVCGRPTSDGVVVTGGAADNPAGLAIGARIVGVARADGTVWTADTMLESVNREPLCRASIPNPLARKDVAAASLFSVLDEGDVLSVVDVDGTAREITLPARSESPRSCSDPLVRESRIHVRDVYQRDDGVIVVVLPTLGAHSEHPFPANMTTALYRTWIAEGLQGIDDEVAALAAVDDVTGLVWDLRGNTGGSAEFGMALLAQMSDVEGSIGNCFARERGTSPPTYSDDVEYPFPYAALASATLPAPPITLLPAGTKQAVVTDGLTYSAGDWMAFHAHALGIDVVGTPAAGAFGYTVGGSFVIDPITAPDGEHADIINFVSGAHCIYDDGTPMETKSVVDVEVELDAGDITAGIDTQLEAAAAIVLGG